MVNESTESVRERETRAGHRAERGAVSKQCKLEQKKKRKGEGKEGNPGDKLVDTATPQRRERRKDKAVLPPSLLENGC